MKTSLLLLIVTSIVSKVYSQATEEKRIRQDYLSFQAGFIVDRYNSLGLRTFFEYQKDLKKNWQFGISYEHSRHVGLLVTDVDDLPSNLSQLSLNGYYKLNAIKDRLFWTAGVGVGALHVAWEDNDRLGITTNVSLTLNIRVTMRLYLEASPLIILLPTNRVYYSSLAIENFNNFFALTLLPVGVKVKL